MLAGFTHAPVVELSERLAALTGLGHAFYGSDGASATEIALKMSAHLWRNSGRPAKNRFIGLAGGYHGETVGALAVTDIALFREAYAPLVRLAATVPSPDARGARAGESAAEVARRGAAALEAWLAEHHEETAALIVEPLVQCAAGMAMHDAEYLRLARALCDRYEVHLVVDEIATGFGRTGTHVRAPAGRHPARLHLPVQGTDRRHAAAVGRADHRRGLRRPFTTTRWRAASCIRTRTPATRWPAAPRWPRWRFSSSEDTLARNAVLARALDEALAPLTAHPRVRHARHLGMIWAWDVDRRPCPISHAATTSMRWRAACCCARSAARSTPCRPMCWTTEAVQSSRKARWPRLKPPWPKKTQADARMTRSRCMTYFVTGTDTGVGKTLVVGRAAAHAGARATRAWSA